MFDDSIHIILNFILTLLLGLLVGWLKGRRSKTMAYNMATKALAHDALFRQCRYILEEDTITEAELENLEHLYAAYSELGMNGAGEKMYNECRAKHIKNR